MAINEVQKWPTDKAKYDKHYLRLFGKRCNMCDGRGKVLVAYSETCILEEACEKCNGLGWMEKK